MAGLKVLAYLLRMPPRSEALRHSGGERRLFTSAMVTLYLEVELRRDKRPGTEQNKSVGLTTQVPPWEGKMHMLVRVKKDSSLRSRPYQEMCGNRYGYLPLTSRYSEDIPPSTDQDFVYHTENESMCTNVIPDTIRTL